MVGYPCAGRLSPTGNKEGKKKGSFIGGLMEMPSDPNAKARVRTAFVFLFVLMIALPIGAYFTNQNLFNLDKVQETIAAREGQTALQGITDPGQIDEVLRRHPSNKFLATLAMATNAANETSAAMETLSNEIEPSSLSKDVSLGSASRGDLEALRRDLKTAEANAGTFMPRYVALMKTERDKVEAYALSHLEKDTVRRLLDFLDKRQAETAALVSRTLLARAEFYRAYENYVAVLAREFGTYKVANGQFIFPFQLTVERYNAAANAMTAAAKRVSELEEERKALMRSQLGGWMQFVNGK